MSGQDQFFRRVQALMLSRYGGSVSRTLDMTKLPAEPIVRGLTAAQLRAITVRSLPPPAPQGKGHGDE